MEGRPWDEEGPRLRKESAISVKLFDLVGGVSGALDLISPEVVGHHKRVAATAARLGEVLGLSPADLSDLLLAGLVHDVGAFTLKSRLSALEFDIQNVEHAEAGYRLLRKAPFLERPAELVRRHHLPWSARARDPRPDLLFLGNVLNLADRVDVLVRRDQQAEAQAGDVRRRIEILSGPVFAPEAVAAFRVLAADREFWRDMSQPFVDVAVRRRVGVPDVAMTFEQVMAFSRTFSQIIDFRSRFTATHSRGVAESAVALAERVGFSEAALFQLRLAGNLHDLGKLAIPSEILEKPAALSVEEFEVMKTHPLVTERVLGAAPGLERVVLWAACHHERLTGKGYPHGRPESELDSGCRIMAVADVFTAITEDRPYRKGMDREKARRTMQTMAEGGHLDPDLTALLLADWDEINDRRSKAQAEAQAEFEEFYGPAEA